MTTTQAGSRAALIRTLILDADGNLFDAQSLQVGYEDGAVRTEANPALVRSAREETYGGLIDAFEAARWGNSSRAYHAGLGAKNGFREGDLLFVTFHHPSTLTLAGHSQHTNNEMEPRP